MTSRELLRLLDKEGTLSIPTSSGDTLTIGVRILDARENFGRVDVLVEPITGEGQAWYSADNVKLRGK